MAISAKPYRLPIPGALRGTAATNTKTRGGVPTKYRVMSYRTRFAGGAIYSGNDFLLFLMSPPTLARFCSNWTRNLGLPFRQG